MKYLVQSTLGRFQIIAWLEGISLILLVFITMPVKYLLEIREPNQIIGLLHGILFVLYVLISIQTSIERKWTIKTLFWALLAAILPFGTFYFTRRMLPKN